MPSLRPLEAVVRAWRDMELFSPQTVDEASPGDILRPSIDWTPGFPLPWDEHSYLQRRPIPEGKVWSHTVYLWVYDLPVMYDCLDRIYLQDEEAFDERPSGQSAVASFVVDDEGRIEAGSIVLSAAAWGLGRCLRSEHRSEQWFEEFAQTAERLEKQVIELCGMSTEDPEKTGLRITGELMIAIGSLVRAATGLPKQVLLPVTAARVQSFAVNPETDRSGGDFLNSFILDDLGRTADAVRSGNGSAVLLDYLGSAAGERSSNRIDTVVSPGAVYAQVRPGTLPYGRWPSRPEHSLAFSQQLAVDLSVADVAGGAALRSVNGPPGTGKTTLLRDVVAGLVVERAIRLADLSRPADAFVGRTSWKSRGRERTLHLLDPALTGFEMIVASANNKAVQNVSDELPDIDAVRGPWTNADYLKEIATEVRHSYGRKGDAWGLIAARLGSKDNRRAFADAFWKHGRDWADGPPTFRRFLEKAQLSPTKPWSEAVADFSRVLKRVDELTDQAHHAEWRLQRFTSLTEEQPRLAAEITAWSCREREASGALTSCQGDLAEADAQVGTAVERREIHLRARPGFWTTLCTFGSALREWSERGQPYEEALSAAYVRQDGARQAVAEAEAEVRRLRREGDELAGRQARLEVELEELSRRIARDRRRWGKHYPDAEWLADEERRELSAPWAEEAVNAARSEAFLAALDLHLVWFEHCSRKLIPSMRGAMDVVTGSAPRGLDPATARAAWQVFFMVVPLVSTTFDSLGRMFSHLEGESLGWLFIDEAGQARPQAAVGALWRAQHALVVGDPQQLTPIVTLPPRAEANIAAEHRVGRLALPSHTSAQGVADGVNPWGTYLGSGDDPLWVGTPLRVHRRCDDPMFTVSNKVAYGGLMINGVHRGPEDRSALPPSSWRHVPARSGCGHALKEDAALAEQLVRGLLDGSLADGEKVAPGEIIVISPFRAMAGLLSTLPKRVGAPVRAGTVHTAQGQEAAVVIFVLGGDPDRPGARAWAASTPNLVNVAASRAKRRLYVVGDHDAWSRLPYFSTLAEQLPRVDEAAGSRR